MHRLALTCGFTALFGSAGCTSPAQGYCAAAQACNEEGAPFDVVGESDDSVYVCEVEQQGGLDTLRANEEPACTEVADAREAYFACVRDKYAEGEECAGLRKLQDNECADEAEAADEALKDADGACGEDAKK